MSYFLSSASSSPTLALLSKNSSHSPLLLSTRSGSAAKLVHKFSSTSSSHHSYFCRIVRIWNSLPPIDLTLSFLSIKQQIKQYFWSIFYHNLTLLCPVPSMLFVLVSNVAIYLLALNFPLSFFGGVLIALIIIPSELSHSFCSLHPL